MSALHRSRRWGYDGWALKQRAAATPLVGTFSPTRRGAREHLAKLRDMGLLGRTVVYDVVRVKLSLTPLPGPSFTRDRQR